MERSGRKSVSRHCICRLGDFPIGSSMFYPHKSTILSCLIIICAGFTGGEIVHYKSPPMGLLPIPRVFKTRYLYNDLTHSIFPP